MDSDFLPCVKTWKLKREKIGETAKPKAGQRQLSMFVSAL